MTRVETVERELEALSAAELAEFRRWYAELDAELWDRQLEADVHAGKLDALADEALRKHAAGQSSTH